MHLHVQFVGAEPTAPAAPGHLTSILNEEQACGCCVTADEKWLVAEVERIDPNAYKNDHLGSVETALVQLAIELRGELAQLRTMANRLPAVDPWLAANIKNAQDLAYELTRVRTPAESALVAELADSGVMQ